MRVLIADDDLTSRIMLASVLEKCGHSVVTATNGGEAWAALQQADPPRLGILDWIMPVLDGAEICRRARASEIERPPYLILLTSRVEKTDIVEGLDAGANDYISKPFDPLELKARVDVGCRMVSLADHLADSIKELREALAQIKTLRGIVPICASCKKIRDDKGYWNQVEAYVSSHSEAHFSHGLCPDCLPRFFPESSENQNSPTT
jgi:phosphoserine phosphatase RsbU/P